LDAVDNSIDTIVVDMPWGQRCSSPKRNRRLYPKLLRGEEFVRLLHVLHETCNFILEWYRVLRAQGQVFALTLERKLMTRLLESLDLRWRLVDRTQCSIGFKVCSGLTGDLKWP